MTFENIIDSEAEIARLYDAPSERAVLKQIDRLDEHCRAFIAAAPLMFMATCGRNGADCSPRGGAPGFVEVADDRLLLIPDGKGNNRLDSLRNIIHNPVIGLIFVVPGVNETLRVNGKACVSQDPGLLARFASADRNVKTVVAVTVEEAFIQCAKSLVRADIWNPSKYLPRAMLPSLGTILAAHTNGKVDAVEYDRRAAR